MSELWTKGGCMDNLENLSKEDLLILVRAITCGSSPAEALEALVPEKQRDTIIVLHSILCSQNHAEGGCQFYNEQNWTDVSHTYWIGLVGGILSKTETDITKLDKIVKYLLMVFAIKNKVEKEEGEDGLKLFNYLLQIKDV